MTTLTLANKIDAILAAGSTYKQIAESADCDPSTIFRIRTGAISNPSYSVGKAIDDIHAQLSKPKKKAAA